MMLLRDSASAPTRPHSAIVEDLNDAQREAVISTEGPLLLIAGPGAGKTLTLVRRTLHILTTGLADPSQIVLCTFHHRLSDQPLSPLPQLRRVLPRCWHDSTLP